MVALRVAERPLTTERQEMGRKELNGWLRIHLTQAELRQLERAVNHSGAPSRAFLIFEAIQAGLRNTNLREAQGRRVKKVNLRVPPEIKERIKQVAEYQAVTQQGLLRYFLFEYLASEPWRKTRTVTPAIVPIRNG